MRKPLAVTDADAIEVSEFSPESAGWIRVPGRPRTWEKPDGTLYEFSPRAREVLVAPKENLPAMTRRIAKERGLSE